MATTHNCVSGPWHFYMSQSFTARKGNQHWDKPQPGLSQRCQLQLDTGGRETVKLFFPPIPHEGISTLQPDSGEGGKNKKRGDIYVNKPVQKLLIEGIKKEWQTEEQVHAVDMVHYCIFLPFISCTHIPASTHRHTRTHLRQAAVQLN